MNNSGKYEAKLNFDTSNSFDLVLTSDDTLNFDNGSLSVSGLDTTDIVFHYDFSVYSGTTSIYSIYNYNNKISSDITLHDIGLTGIDTGYVQNMSGETISFTTGSTLIIKPVTGSTYTYPLSLVVDDITSDSVLKLEGGFYQGFYKLDGYNYELIPNRTQEGITLNFWLRKDITTPTGNTLDSDNFFFFMGSRAENKYHNIFSGETGLTTFTGVTLQQDSGTTQDVNGIGFYYNNDSIGFKYIINRQDSSGNTIATISQKNLNIELQTTGNTWFNFTILVKRKEKLYGSGDCLFPEPELLLEDTGDCITPIPDTQKFDITIFIDGRPIFNNEIEEPIFRSLLTDKDKQQGVPYNISIGGGSQGLLETQTFNGPDIDDQNLLIQDNFAGSFYGKIGIATMYTKPLSIPEIIKNYYFYKDIYNKQNNFGGAKIIVSNIFLK